MESGSISRLITQLKTVEASDAQSKIFRRYYPELVEHLRRCLSHQVLRGGDEEDLAVSAFQALFESAKKYDQLADRGNLWALLVTIARRKALNQLKRKAPRGDSGLAFGQDEAQQLKDSTDAAAELVVNEMLEKLPKDEFRLIAVLKLEGYKNKEIAGQMNCAVATVERRLKHIRTCWKPDPDDE